MAIESAQGVEMLLNVGLQRRVTGSSEVEISTGDGRWSNRQVLVLRHSPSPKELDRALAALKHDRHDGVLFVVARAGSALEGVARGDNRVAYAAIDDGTVSFLGEVRHVEGKSRAVAPHPGRVSWARLGALRLFALTGPAPLPQSEIARRIGVSHVAVGKQLPTLEPLVERTPSGWRAADRGACWDRFMTDYPGPRGLASYWAAIGEVSDQLERVESVVPADALVLSGDVAADFYAPWRRPSRITGYVSEQPPLEEHGFAPVPASEASIELRVPKDPTVLPMSRVWSAPNTSPRRRYADPLLTAWDLSRSPGGDVASAIEQLRQHTVQGSSWS